MLLYTPREKVTTGKSFGSCPCLLPIRGVFSLSVLLLVLGCLTFATPFLLLDVVLAQDAALAQEADAEKDATAGQDAAESSESTPEGEETEVEEVQVDPDLEKLSSLESVVSSLEKISTQIKEAQRELRSASAKGREAGLQEKILQLSAEKESLEKNFVIIASETEIVSDLADGRVVDFNWGTELKELLAPLFQEVKRLTSRPREIERLRSQISFHSNQSEEIATAIENVRTLKDKAELARVRRRLVELHADWKDKLATSKTELSVANQKLQQLQSERQSIASSVREIFDLFFKSRGRNLLVAVVASLVFWLAFRRLFVLVQRFSPFHKGQLSMKARVFNVLYLAFTGFGGVLVFLIVLFFFGDWVLLTVALLLLVGAVWSSKQGIPKYWAQALLLLNMGQVREGERVLIDGIPWKVKRLNFYTALSNPNLGGEVLRLPLEDMTELRSRPSQEKEPWFPTLKGDWVVLSDETYGKIVVQTHDAIELVLLGGSRKTYQVAEFLSQTPLVLTKGFRHQIQFGVDYAHQEISTSSIPADLKAFVRQGLFDSDFTKDDFTLKVEFAEAGASALTIAVIGDFKGAHASKYRDTKRLLNKLCVDACNEHGWVIPFDQLTVHMANAS